MERFLWVCLGGAAGTGARYLIASWAVARFGPSFPVGILIVNLVGCFLMGAVAQLGMAWAWSPTMRAAVAVGFLGGLTTYSSFNHDTSTLLLGGATGTAVLNVALTLFGGLLAGWLGLAAARQLTGG